MRAIVAACGFAICAAALLAESPPAPLRPPAASLDDNPGYVDDPTAKALILAQLADNDIDPALITILYLGSAKMPDDSGAVNFYKITNVKTGKISRVSVAIVFMPTNDGGSI